MRIKRFLCMLLVSAITISCFTVSTGAVVDAEGDRSLVIARATGKFNTDIPAKTLFKARTDFPLEVGETIAINAAYSPQYASVDFGFIAPDGLFYAVNTKNGSFDETIEVDQRGYYTLAIRNNASVTISVSGYVTY